MRVHWRDTEVSLVFKSESVISLGLTSLGWLIGKTNSCGLPNFSELGLSKGWFTIMSLNELPPYCQIVVGADPWQLLSDLWLALHFASSVVIPPDHGNLCRL